MHEPFRDRAVRELDDREHGPRAPAGLEAGRRVGREGDEVAHAEAPGLDPSARA